VSSANATPGRVLSLQLKSSRNDAASAREIHFTGY
jgi:hypothetical protein